MPKLRFPEFDSELERKKLGDVTTWASGGTPPKDNSSYWNGNIPWISASSMRGLEYSDSNLKITEEGLNAGSKLATKGSILILVRGSMLFNKIPIGIATRDVAFNQDVKSVIVDNEVNTKYILYWFVHKERKILNKVTGTGIGAGKLDMSDLKSLKISIPTPSEQTKIASFLTTVDKRINLLQKKKAELEQYKKGVMQKLFSQTIRFKDKNGNDFPDWEEKNLRDIGNTFNGLTGKTKVDFGEGKPYIQYMQIFSDSKIDTSRFGLVNVEESENQNLAQYGDVFFTTSSETPNEIGTSSVLTEQVDEVYLNSFCFGYRPNSLDELVPEFSQFFFRSDKLRKEIIKLAQGSTRFNMSKVELMKLKFEIPCKTEQQKIANFLPSIDQYIENVAKQIDSSKEWKKGLLQKMFV